MIGALAYLVITSARNGLVGRIRQLRNPRYAMALALGIGYFWLVFYHPRSRGGGQPNPLESDTFASLFPVALLVYAGVIWILGADRSALAFTQAEVSMLFSAPVSRRGLVIYKLVRAQSAVLTTSILWLVLFHSSGSSVRRVAASWILLTMFSLHRLGVALVRASQAEHGVTGLRRNWLSIAIFGATAAVLASSLYSASARLGAAVQSGEIGHVLVSEFAQAPLSWVVYPFRVATAPLFARSNEAWALAILPALVLLGLHVVWVLRGDTAFEEAAAEASAAQALRVRALRARGATGGVIDPKRARRTVRLASTGTPEVALFWKNYLWLLRTGQFRALLGLPLFALVLCLAFAGRSTLAEILVVVICGVTAVVTLIFGPMTMRNDLRAELRQLPLLKTMPLRGREIMLAEVLSSALPVAMMQFLLASVALLALSFIPTNTIAPVFRLGLFVASPVFLAGLSLANFTIHNGMALLFPAWVRIGVAAGGAGVEAMGQMMLTSIVTLLLLGILLILPAIAAAAVYFVMQWPAFFATAGAGIAAGIVCGLEGYLLIGVLGGSLDRLEPMQVG